MDRKQALLGAAAGGGPPAVVGAAVGGSLGARPAGGPVKSWLENWSEWEIQAVVAVSFGPQAILFFLAGIRHYSVWSVLKVLLWLVYLLSDTAAIYALGHMSASLSKTSSNKQQLVAFWAPFLLLHLGGQDTITAYALEDNKLWLCHLLNMFLQVAGTGYVLYKYIIADKATIVSAAMLVSVTGFVKYGERIWALRCASKDWWNKAHYTKHAKLSPALKEFVWGLLRGEKSDMVKVEDVAIRSGYWARKLTGFNQSEKLDWSLRLEFHNCVFIWHIATDTFLSDPAIKLELVDTSNTGMAEAVALSLKLLH